MLRNCPVPTFYSSHLFTFNESLDSTDSMASEALGAMPTMDRKNCRDFESSVLGLSVMAFIITVQGTENGGEGKSGNLELDSSKDGLGSGRHSVIDN